MALNSATVSSGDDILATQYNNIRKDIVERAGDVATTGGTANVRTLTLDAQITTYTTGLVIQFKSHTNNTGSATINVNSLGAKTLKKIAGGTTLGNLEGDDLGISEYCKAIYDGVDFQLLTPAYDISTANKKLISGGSTTDASQAHDHTSKVLQGSRGIATASGVQNIAHGLGRTPKRVTIEAYVVDETPASSNTGLRSQSFGFADSSNNKCSYEGARGFSGSAILQAGNDSSNVINIRLQKASLTYGQQTAVATFDGTNVILTWTLTSAGSPSGTIYFTIVVE